MNAGCCSCGLESCRWCGFSHRPYLVRPEVMMRRFEEKPELWDVLREKARKILEGLD